MSESQEVKPENQEVTTVVRRHIRPGHDKDYDRWFSKLFDVVQKFPGFRGVTVVIPGGKDPEDRIMVYRFADKATLDKWESSPERANLVSEVQNYATELSVRATGLETWFKLPDARSVVPPPRWKMALVTLVGAETIIFVARTIVGSYLIHLGLAVSQAIYVLIVVLGLTYVAMPLLSRALRRWLYPSS